MKPLRKCSECDGTFRSYRADALTCGPVCKKRRQRRILATVRVVPQCASSISAQIDEMKRHAKGLHKPAQVAETLTKLDDCAVQLMQAARELMRLDSVWLQGTGRSVPDTCRERGRAGTSPH